MRIKVVFVQIFITYNSTVLLRDSSTYRLWIWKLYGMEAFLRRPRSISPTIPNHSHLLPRIRSENPPTGNTWTQKLNLETENEIELQKFHSKYLENNLLCSSSSHCGRLNRQWTVKYEVYAVHFLINDERCMYFLIQTSIDTLSKSSSSALHHMVWKFSALSCFFFFFGLQDILYNFDTVI